jgi:hypothetical protein
METPKMSGTPYGLAMISIGQKKMKNKKIHACRLVLPGPSSAKKKEKLTSSYHSLWASLLHPTFSGLCVDYMLCNLESKLMWTPHFDYHQA